MKKHKELHKNCVKMELWFQLYKKRRKLYKIQLSSSLFLYYYSQLIANGLEMSVSEVERLLSGSRCVTMGNCNVSGFLTGLCRLRRSVY